MTLLLTQEEFNQARSATLSLSGGDSVDGSITNANESAALPDDADSTDPPSSDGSIITTLFDGSISRVQSDWCREDHLEPLSYLESESEGGVWEEPRAVLMAGSDPPPSDPLCTPIHVDAPTSEVEAARKAL
jgi:hypothetical protein